MTTADGRGADAYVSNDSNKSPDTALGLNSTFEVRYFDGVRAKITYLRFGIGTNLLGFNGATLSVNLTSANRSRTVNVYGLVDGDPGESWNETNITYNTAPGMLATNLGYAALNTNLVLLGTWDWSSGAGVKTSDPATLDLAPFLAADKDGQVTFVIYTAASDSSHDYFGETKEAGNGNPPTLTMPNALTKPDLPTLKWAAGSGTWDIGATANWQDSSSASATYQEVGGLGNDVVFEDSASGTAPITVDLGTIVNPLSITVNASKDYAISGSGSIAGITGLTKQGSGTLTLDTINTFLGPVNLTGGTIKFSTVENFGDASTPITIDGGTLEYASGNLADISTHPITIAAGGATVDDGGNTIYLSNPIGNGGSGGLTKTGSGSLTLSGDNNYSGNTVISQGTLSLNAGAGISNSPAIIVEQNAILDGTLNYPGIALNGSIGQMVAGTGTVNGIIVTPGSTVTPATNGVVGTLKGGDLTMSGGKIVMDISPDSGDEIVLSGGLTLNSGTVDLLVSGTLTNGTYKLIQYGYQGNGAAANILVTGFSQPGQVAFLSDGTYGEIDLIVAPLSSQDLTWVGDGSLNAWDVGSTANWTASGGGSAAFNLGDAVTFNDSGSTTPAVAIMTSVIPSAITVEGSSDYTFMDGTYTGAGKITGKTGITKSGSGTLTLLTQNNNSGPTVINGGTLAVGNGDGFSKAAIGSGDITDNGSLVFAAPPGTNKVVGAISGTGSLTQNGDNTLVLSGELSYTGPTIINAGVVQFGTNGAAGALATSAITNNGSLILDSGRSWSYSGPIAGTGGLTKLGDGMLTLSGSNSYAGSTTISGGTLALGDSEEIPNGDGAGNLIVQSGGTLDLNGHDETVNNLSSTIFAGGRIVNNAGSGTNVLTFGTDSDADSSVVIADNDGTGGVVSVVKNGAGTEILRGASTYSGGTVLNAGTLHARSQNDAFGTGPITLNGGTIINHQSTIANPLNVVTDSYLTADGNCTFAGPITGTNTLHVFYDNETFSWGGAADIMAGFGGTLDFAGCGPGGNMRFYGSTGGDQVTFLMDSTNSITLNSRNSGTIHLGELIGNSNAIVAGATDSGNVSMYVIGGKNTSSTFAGTFGNPGGGGNPVGLTKIGTGTFTLAGVNTYEGPTVVSNGVFAVTAEGGLTNSSVITVVAPGKLDTAGFGGTLALGAWTVAQTLGGNGTIMGNVTADVISPVTIAPGAPVGTLSISGSLTMNNNTTAVIALNRTNAAANCGSIAATSITAGGTLNVTNAGPDLVAGDTFKLFSTAVTGFDTVNLPQANADGSVTYTWTNNLAEDGTVTVLTGASPVNTNPTNLEVTVSGNQLSLSWPADHTGWRLQVQTNDLSTGISTNWYDVSGSETINQTNVTINSDNGSVFYRLVY